MCGIFFSKTIKKVKSDVVDNIKIMLSYRGPDEYRILQYKHNNYYYLFIFTRLSINDVANGMQPFINNENYTICNGEIYNKTYMENKYNLYDENNNSDCLVTNYIQEKEIDLNELDGVFAFVTHSKNDDKIFAARDIYGVRPLFYYKNNEEVIFSSNLKSIDAYLDRIGVNSRDGTLIDFPPGSHYKNGVIHKYYKDKCINAIINKQIEENTTFENHCINIRNLFESAIEKRVKLKDDDIEIGCLLSGGLDSSLVCSVLSRHVKNLQTFSIGLKGSPDLEYARKVADYLGTIHHEILLTEEDFLGAIDETIYHIETFDTTTIRASVGNRLVAKYVEKNTKIKILFGGDGADEIFGSYRYFKNAPSEKAFLEESIRLSTEIHYFDVKRADRSISSCGLELRVPFLDKDFADYILYKLDPKYKVFYDKLEKNILRESFKDNYLPDDVLWRKKEAFSDGVTSVNRSWSEILSEYVEKNKTFTHIKKYDFLQPKLNETNYYRIIYDSIFVNTKHHQLIPYYWLPRFCGDIEDPSARVLDVY